MTTVVIANGVLAADSFATDDSTAIQVCKCARLPNGDVAGGAGDLGEVTQALAWLAKGGKGDAPEIPSCSILYTKKGETLLASSKWPGVRVKGPAAIGSGSQGALVALRMGKTAAEAIKAVIGIDPSTGGEIDVLPVLPARAKARKRA